MAIGSILLGGVADKIGRRPTILGCLAVMAFGMVMATTVQGTDRPVGLAHRHRSGHRRHARCDQRGRGGVLERAAAAPERVAHVHRIPARRCDRRHRRCPAAAGPRLARGLLLRRGGHYRADSDRVPLRARVGAVARAQATRPRAEQINPRWSRMGHAPVTALPDIPAEARRAIDRRTSSPQGSLRGTVIVTLAYFFHITTFYFIAKWMPKIVVDMGFAASSAAGVLVWTNVGGAIGGAVFGLLTQRYGVKPLTIGVLLASTVHGDGVRPHAGRPAATVAHLRASPASAPTRASSGCTRSSRRSSPRTFARSGPASPSGSDAAVRCWRRSWPASCSQPGILFRRSR